MVIRKGGDWLDRRFLKWPYTTGLRPDVEEEAEVELSTKLDYFLHNREDERVEFKSAPAWRDRRTEAHRHEDRCCVRQR